MTTEAKKAATRRWYARNKERVAKYSRDRRAANKHDDRIGNLARYGLTVTGYDALSIAQGNVCAICGCACSSGRKLSVDHDHTTGMVRGLLCRSCNVMLGLAKDRPDLLIQASKYLLARQTPLHSSASAS